MPASIDNLDPMNDFMAFLQATHFNKGVSSQDADADDGVKAKSGDATNFSFKAKKTGDLEFSIQPGAVELGPDTVIESGDIDGYSIIQTVPSGNTAWYAWVNIDVTDGAEAAEMLFGASITALTSEEKKHIRQKRLIQISLVDNKITAVKNLQCGNIDIPRL